MGLAPYGIPALKQPENDWSRSFVAGELLNGLPGRRGYCLRQVLTSLNASADFALSDGLT